MRSEIPENSRPIRASIPPDIRIYAVGDIHGRADLLYEITQRIEDDLRRRPIKYAIEIYLGDYIDRGPDSKGVIDQLAVRLVQKRALCLRGNHEALLAAFLHDPAAINHWSQLGAWDTFASYGVSVDPANRSRIMAPADLHRSFLKAFPRTHELFLQCLRNSFCCGDYLFVHAGIRPGIPIESQKLDDLLWIRGEFLNSTHVHEKYVVHGHTPVDHPDIRSNRINIDTGAWISGILTCVAIEGETLLVL